MNTKELLTLTCKLLFISLLVPACAYAYIDPGIGSMLLQGLAAGVITVLLFWKGLWQKIASFFRSNRDEDGGQK